MRALVWRALLVAILKSGCPVVGAPLVLKGSVPSNDNGIALIGDFWVRPNSGASPAARIAIDIAPDEALSNDTQLVYYFQSQGVVAGTRCEQLRDQATVLANLTFASNVTNSSATFDFESLDVYLPRASINDDFDDASQQECTLVVINCDFIRRFDYLLVVDPAVDAPSVTAAPQFIVGVPNPVTIILGSIMLGLFICVGTCCCVRYQNRRTTLKRRGDLRRASTDTEGANGVGHPQDRDNLAVASRRRDNGGAASTPTDFSARLRLIRSALNRNEKTHVHVHRGSSSSSIDSACSQIESAKNMPPSGVLPDSDDDMNMSGRGHELEDGTYDMTSVQHSPAERNARPDDMGLQLEMESISVVRQDSSGRFLPPAPPAHAHLRRSRSDSRDSRHSVSRRSAAAAAEMPSHDDMSPERARQRRVSEADGFDAHFESHASSSSSSHNDSRSSRRRAPEGRDDRARRLSFDRYASVHEIPTIPESPENSRVGVNQRLDGRDTDERQSRDFRNPFDDGVDKDRPFDGRRGHHDRNDRNQNPFDDRDRYDRNNDAFDDRNQNPFDARLDDRENYDRRERSRGGGDRRSRTSRHHELAQSSGGRRTNPRQRSKDTGFDDRDFRDEAADFFGYRRDYGGYER